MEEKSRNASKADELTGAMLEIVAERGLDRLSVREVATHAGVSIGTVQHYFHTKDAMLSAAFGEIVRRVYGRVGTLPLTEDPRRDLDRALRELLPLDERRHKEAVIQLAFSSRAATSPELAELQRATLNGVRASIETGFARAGHDRARARTCARIALATADGLAQHAVSSAGALGPRQLTAALDSLLDLLTAGPGTQT